MNTWLQLGLSAFVIGVVYLAARALAVYIGTRGERLVVCPETKDYAVVELDATTAARKSLRGKSWTHLKDCSRWETRARCDEPCLHQIAESADGCLVRAYVDKFYRDKHCAICHKPIGPIDWVEHMPGALGPDGRTVTWDAVPTKELPRFLKTHLPVCWDCHITESFRRDHALLVTDRPWTH
ncbi:MAG: hypothetical protein HYX28_05635 [Candidatus Koribacter versatilis]|uniref:Uncharacterized protein n=1 Tax=Candidatus Korobacter versatilis TaxID=658062 RepID=A0A932A803_9BACT|nr:hypothetical protein [Candidatus Koribacter versatilis]